MRIEHTTVAGWEPAIRGMRNARESWAKSDSGYRPGRYSPYEIGPADIDLCCRLIRAGSSDRKFLRMLTVSCDIVAPRYWWVDFDTYKVGTVKNSCSTMNSLGTRDLTPDDFADGNVLPETLAELNRLGREMRAGKRDRKSIRRIKQVLPEGFMLRATWMANYETLLSVYRDRRTHRLDEFSGEGGFCEWIESLPYMREFIAAAGGGK